MIKKYGPCPACGKEVLLNTHEKPNKHCHECEPHDRSNLSTIGKILIITLSVFAILAGSAFFQTNPFVGIIIALASLLIILFLGDSFKLITKEEREQMHTYMEVLSLVLVCWGLLISNSAIDITKSQVADKREYDLNLLESNFQSLNTKLDFVIANAAVFGSNEKEYIEGSANWQSRFPEEYESYIQELGIKDHDLVGILIAIENDSKRINEAIQYTNTVYNTNDSNRAAAIKKEIWSKEGQIILHMAKNACRAKRLLEEKYGFLYNWPDFNKLIEIKTPGLTIDPKYTCNRELIFD